MLSEDGFELLLKCDALMMGGLALDIGDRVFDPRYSNAECSVAFLPSEASKVRKGIVNPLGGIPFQYLKCFCDAECGRHGDEGVNMILNASNLKSFHIRFTRNAPQVGPKPVCDIGGDPRCSILRREDDM